LQRIGIKSTPSHTYQCSFKLPAKAQVPTVSAARHVPRSVKPHRTGNFEQLKMELRISVDSGNCMINLRGYSKDFKGDTELNIKESEYDNMTVDDILSKLGRRWPILEPEGWFQGTEGTVPFNGKDRIVATGCTIDPEYTASYYLIFPLADKQQTAELAAAKAAVTERLAQRQQAAPSAPGGGPHGGISEGSIGVNVRIFYDSGSYNLQVTGAGGDFRADCDMNIRKDEYLSMTFGDLKKKLRRWPETSSNGKYHAPTGNVPFTDQDKLANIGLVASEDGRPMIHQFSWEIV